MKINKSIYIALAALVLCQGCKLNRIVEREVETHEVKAEISSLDSVCELYSKESIKFVEETELKWTKIVYSEPDSSGCQHIISTETMELTKKQDKQNESETSSKIEEHKEAEVHVKNDTHIQSKTQTQVEGMVIPCELWITVGIVLVIILAIIVVNIRKKISS